MSLTANMNLNLPSPTITLGPAWATQLVTALERLDEHDHSSGRGVKITPAGLNINTNLDINNNIFFNFQAIRFRSQNSALTGAANANALQSVNGNLYFTNGSGSSIQITDGGSIVSSPGSASIFATTAVSSDVTISNSDTFVYLIVDTSATRTITLPLASGVSAGRLYIIKDSDGTAEANNITIDTQGSDTVDGASSAVLDSNFGSWTIVGDGTSAWYIS